MRAHPDVPTAFQKLEAEGDELKQLLAHDGAPAPIHSESTRVDGVRVGSLVAMMANGGVPLVTFVGQPSSAALAARTTIDLCESHIGMDVVLLFEDGDPNRPVIVGCIRNPAESSHGKLPERVSVDADGERVVVSAQSQVVLRCGKASITLTRAGKVLIEGAFILTRSSGVNRIKGGSVEIN